MCSHCPYTDLLLPFSNLNAGLRFFSQQWLIPYRSIYQLDAALVIPFRSQAPTRNKEPLQEKQKAASCCILDGHCSTVPWSTVRLTVRT